jgi:pilus assembly protein CpaC
VPQSLGTVSIEYRPYGTELDFVPIVMGNGIIRLELRPRVSEPDPALSVTINGTTVPALTIREVDTGVEMRAGQTLAIAGLVQTRSQVEKRGVPWLKDVPYVGVVFSRKQSRENEVETLIMVTPHLVDAMDACEVPHCLPGTRTTVPNDKELYWKQYVEVPKCCPPDGCPEGAGPGFVPGPVGIGPHGHVPGMVYPQGSAPPMVIEEVNPSSNGRNGRISPLPPTDEPAPQPPRAPTIDPPSLNKSRPMVKPTIPASTSKPSRASQPPAAVRRASPPQQVPARTTSTTASSGSDRNNPPEPRPGTRTSAGNSAPGFIGPTGYDVQ